MSYFAPAPVDGLGTAVSYFAPAPVDLYAPQCPTLLLRLLMVFLALSRSHLQLKVVLQHLLWLQHLFSVVNLVMMSSETPWKFPP